MRRSLPERTVDAWVSAYIVQEFSHALIWAPTQRRVVPNWDLGAALGDGKIFILENKATTPVIRNRKTPLETHRIEIDLDQLDWYCNEVERRAESYYLLPNPPWVGEPDPEPVPSQSVFRHPPTRAGFEEWAWVIRSRHLRRQLLGRLRIETHELPFPDCVSLRDFINEFRECQRGTPITGEGARLAHLTKAPETILELPPEQLPPASRERTEEGKAGSALAVFVGAEDLSPN